MFATVIHANHISKRDDKMAIHTLTDEDVKAILKLSKDEKISDRVNVYQIVLNICIYNQRCLSKWLCNNGGLL